MMMQDYELPQLPAQVHVKEEQLAVVGEDKSTSSSSVAPSPPLYDYRIQDQFPDESKILDAWSKYLRARVFQRRDLYRSLDTSEQDLIHKEIRRITYFREHFKDYRVHSSDTLSLVALLDDSRTKWRQVAVKRATEDQAKVQKQTERTTDMSSAARDRHARNRQVRAMVQEWGTEKFRRYQKSMDPDEYMLGIKDANVTSKDDPRKPDYGYNGWVIAWEEDKGWTSLVHPLVGGEFPHQKISIQQFLYNKAETPLKRRSDKKQFRYFHLPANNMKWVEEAISRYYDEDNIEFDGKSVLSLKSNSQRLLRNELWRGQQRGGVSLPAHARQIATRCQSVPSAPAQKSDLGRPSGTKRGKDVVLFMPYLHWEIEKRLRRMRQFVQVAKSRKDQSDRLRRATTNSWKRGGVADVAQASARAANKPKRPMTGFEHERQYRDRIFWRPQTPLAKYFWHVAKLYQIIDEAADGRLIEDHLYGGPPLHMRRTLEQFYYWTAEDTTSRDRSQVVCRATRNPNMDLDPEATSRTVMVDQLWVWILDDNTIISSFPRRWGRNKPDPSAVHRGIRDRLGALPADEITSIYDIALVVIDECSKVFFDDSKPLDERPDVVDLFSSAISNIAESKTIAYEGFGRDISKISIETLESAERLLRKSLNIGFEWSILEEAQQVIDELQIMQEIFNQQITVMRRLDNILRDKYGVPGTTTNALDELDISQQRTLDRLAGMMADMEQRKEELNGMEVLQTKTRQQLRELLDMKQQQANIIEAKAAIRRADESVLQGRSIVVFTVVTIFFLPLSFFSSVFGMNASELNDGNLPLSTLLIYMFGISSIVIVLSLAIAFSTWVRTALAVMFGLSYATVEDWLGWRNKKAAYNSTAIRNIHREKMKELESRDRARRLTEIDSRRDTMNSKQTPPPGMQHRSTWDVRNLGHGGSFMSRFKRSKRGAEASENV